MSDFSSEHITDIPVRSALFFVVLLGVVSLLADVTYEGARSITGPYLAYLGASGAVVGFVAGFGELIGYGLRIFSGLISDRTKKYWTITVVGYIINLISVPLLALTGHWQWAVVFIVCERAGKAIRTPARDAMLSHATQVMGRGWGFGLHEAMDQIGAISGPLILALILSFGKSYRFGFATLGIPAILAISVLVTARWLFPRPHDLEVKVISLEPKGIPKIFWLYLVAAGLIGAGTADYPLIAFHLGKTAVVTASWIPILYAIAMGVDGVAALIFGRLFDRFGFRILAVSTLLSSLFAPLVFRGGFKLVLLGMVFWGIGMGASESIMRAAVAEMVPSDHRGTAYGIFNTGFGVFWFLGSALMGILYDRSKFSLIVFSVAAQLLAIPILLSLNKKTESKL